MSCTSCGYAGTPATANGREWCPSCEGACEAFIEMCAKHHALGKVLRIKLKPLPAVGRNEPCPCGSGRKYKKCHGR